jgi:hypothetical protein
MPILRPGERYTNTMSARSQTAPTLAGAQSAAVPNHETSVAPSIFAARDFIRPNERETYIELQAQLIRDLAPAGILENTLVDEIRRAMWRLRRCGQVEANLAIGLDNGNGFIFDPMETANPDVEKVQKAVDRARAQAHRLLHKCTAELRRLQTSRHYAGEHVDAADTPNLGIADLRAIAKSPRPHMRVEPRPQNPGAPRNPTSIAQNVGDEPRTPDALRAA